MKKNPQSEQGGPVPEAKARKLPIQVESLARVPVDIPGGLPECPGVYFALDNANRVWYVGMAESSIRDRIKAHDRIKDFKSNSVNVIAWEQTEQAHCRSRETELIEFFHPPLNDRQNFNKLPECDLGLSPEQEIERFLRLRIRLKVIEMELEALKPNIVTRCEQAGGKLEHDLGSVRSQAYKTWAYSDEVELAKLRLKTLKKTEEENGKAILKSVKLSPVAKLNGEALSQEVALFISGLVDTENEDELAQAV